MNTDVRAQRQYSDVSKNHDFIVAYETHGNGGSDAPL